MLLIPVLFFSCRPDLPDPEEVDPFIFDTTPFKSSPYDSTTYLPVKLVSSSNLWDTNLIHIHTDIYNRALVIRFRLSKYDSILKTIADPLLDTSKKVSRKFIFSLYERGTPIRTDENIRIGEFFYDEGVYDPNYFTFEKRIQSDIYADLRKDTLYGIFIPLYAFHELKTGIHEIQLKIKSEKNPEFKKLPAIEATFSFSFQIPLIYKIAVEKTEFQLTDTPNVKDHPFEHRPDIYYILLNSDDVCYVSKTVKSMHFVDESKYVMYLYDTVSNLEMQIFDDDPFEQELITQFYITPGGKADTLRPKRRKKNQVKDILVKTRYLGIAND